VHNVLSGTQYRCEYRRADRSSMFQRNIRFHVEICTVKSIDSSSPDTYYVTFTLITGKKFSKRKYFILFLLIGQARRFKKLCEEIQALFLTSKERLAKQRRPQQQTNENRSLINNSGNAIATNSLPSNSNTPMTPRSNASFISSLFSNTNPTCMSYYYFVDISLDDFFFFLILYQRFLSYPLRIKHQFLFGFVLIMNNV
jgi:hypothetical protein